MKSRRVFFRTCVVWALMAVTMLASRAACADPSYPNRTVRLIVPFPPGQATDVIARLLAKELGDGWKQAVIVENISGGASVIGTVAGRDAPADGYTITFASSSAFAVNPITIPNLSYDPARDFTIVNGVFISPWVIVASPSAPYQTLRELISAAKAKPQSIFWGLGAAALQMGAELVKLHTGVDIVNVPYRGSSQAITDLLGGQVPVLLDTVAATLPHIKAGKMRALATLSADRAPWLPDVPTAVELGYPEVQAAGWGGLAVPKGTSKEIVDKIATAVRRVLEKPEVREQLLTLGAIVDARGPSEWSKFVEAEQAKWSDVARRTNFKPQ